jgi:hypothetical protein
MVPIGVDDLLLINTMVTAVLSMETISIGGFCYMRMPCGISICAKDVFHVCMDSIVCNRYAIWQI